MIFKISKSEIPKLKYWSDDKKLIQNISLNFSNENDILIEETEFKDMTGKYISEYDFVKVKSSENVYMITKENNTFVARRCYFDSMLFENWQDRKDLIIVGNNFEINDEQFQNIIKNENNNLPSLGEPIMIKVTDDNHAGYSIVSKVKIDDKCTNEYNKIFISVQDSYWNFNWNSLKEEQSRLNEDYYKEKAKLG